LAMNLLVDFYCYFSQVEFLANFTWARTYGYSPFPFLSVTTYSMLRPHNYGFLFNRIGAARAAKRIIKIEKRVSGKMVVFHMILLALASCAYLVRVKNTNSVQFSGVRARIQLNGSYCFVDYTDHFDITPGCLYSQITDLTGKALVSSSMATWLVFAAPYLLVFIIDWVVVLARDARSPEVDLSLVWCPTADYQDCQPVSYAAVHPYAMSQSATWFSTLGPFPLDKIAGYGMVPDAWK
ncbi:hypothetical protein HK405_010108, partial [Cladochytrium tenue]